MIRLLLLCLVVFSSLQANANPPLHLVDGTERFSLSGHLSYVEDPSGALQLPDIINQPEKYPFKTLNQPNANFGFTQSAFWLKSQLSYQVQTHSELPQQQSSNWAIYISYPPLAELSAYLYDSQNQLVHEWHTGTQVAFEQRPIQHRGFVLPFTAKSAETYTLYVRAASDTSVQVPLEVWDPVSLLAQDSINIYFWGIYFGILFSLIAYNSFMYVTMQSQNYLHYILYVISLSGIMLFLNGQGFQMIWPNFQLWNLYALPIFTGATVFFATQFARVFLHSKKLTPKTDWMMRLFMAFAALLVIAALVGASQLPRWSGVAGGLLPFILLFASYTSHRAGRRVAKFFAFAWLLFMAGLIVYLANVFGILPSNHITTNALQIGSALEVTMLSLAQAYQIKLGRDRRYQALNNENKAVVKWQKAEQHMLYQAQHHPLTLLPNDSILRLKLTALVQQQKHNPSRFALVLIHINRFSEINKTLGKVSGDQILLEAAQRIQQSAQAIPMLHALEHDNISSTNIAMLDGATFGVIVDNSNESFSAERIAGQLQQTLTLPLNFQGMSITLSSSAGISNYPDHGTDAETLLQHAEVAMTMARRDKQPVAQYDASTDQFSKRRLKLMGDLHQAIKNQQCYLTFQPQINLKTEKITAFEVLLRWHHPSYGLIPPAEVIPMAEQCGQMKHLTRWLLQEALKFGSRLDRLGYQIPLSINISSNNLREQDFVGAIRQILQNHQYNPTKLTLEFNESAIVDNSEIAMQTMRDLQSLGIQMAIDDFGSGHSSLSLLKTLPINQIKLAPELILDITDGNDTRNIVETIVKLSHLLGLPAIAVGVESVLISKCLKEMHCDSIQGNLISSPLRAQDALNWLQDYVHTLPTMKTNEAPLDHQLSRTPETRET